MVNTELDQLQVIADGIGGSVWHSGGGNWGVKVQRQGWEIFFGFADDVLGWDINEMPEWEYIGGGITDLPIDDPIAVIARCQLAIENKEIQF